MDWIKMWLQWTTVYVKISHGEKNNIQTKYNICFECMIAWWGIIWFIKIAMKNKEFRDKEIKISELYYVSMDTMAHKNIDISHG